MRHVLWIPVVAVFLACGGESGEIAPEYTVRDSAGVLLVHNGETGTLPPAALDSPRVTLRIGEVEGAPEYQFFRLWSMAIGPAGEIYATDAGNAELRVYDAEGGFLRKYGRRGSGPGEFEFPSGLWLLGDTIAVYDGRLYRMTLLDADGEVLDTWRAGGTQSGQLSPIAAVAGGWVVAPFRYPGWLYEPGVARRDTTQIAFVASFVDAVRSYESSDGSPRDAGDAVREIVSYPRGRMFGVSTSAGMTATNPLFEPAPRFTVDGLGRVHFSPAGSYVIESYDVEGRLVRRLTRAYTPIPVTAELVDRFRARARAHWDTASTAGEGVLGKENDAARGGLPHVASLPPIGRMLASAEGALWVERIDLVPDPIDLEWQRQPPPPRETKWDIFDPDGRFLGTVTLPPKFTPRVVGDRWTLGILRDELDVQYIAKLEI